MVRNAGISKKKSNTTYRKQEQIKWIEKGHHKQRKQGR